MKWFREHTHQETAFFMTLFCFLCVVHMICSILLEMSVNCIFDECQLHFISRNVNLIICKSDM